MNTDRWGPSPAQQRFPASGPVSVEDITWLNGLQALALPAAVAGTRTLMLGGGGGDILVQCCMD